MSFGMLSSSCLTSLAVTTAPVGLFGLQRYTKPIVAGVAVRHFNHLADVLAVVLGQRQLNGVGLDVGGLLEHARVRRADANHLQPRPR